MNNELVCTIRKRQSKNDTTSKGRFIRNGKPVYHKRLHASTDFASAGVYSFSLFTVKIGRGNEKQWSWLFTCPNMRAVFIEVILKLDTEICLNAIIRFFCTKGANRVQSLIRTRHGLERCSKIIILDVNGS